MKYLLTLNNNRGEHLNTMYTNALWGTQERRAHLMSTKYFKCSCKRCSDPTELGTNFSTLVCNVSILTIRYMLKYFQIKSIFTQK